MIGSQIGSLLYLTDIFVCCVVATPFHKLPYGRHFIMKRGDKIIVNVKLGCLHEVSVVFSRLRINLIQINK